MFIVKLVIKTAFNLYFISENDFEVFDNRFRIYFYFDFRTDRQWYDRLVSRGFSENFLDDRRLIYFY